MADKKYNVILSDKAASMLINHVRFLAKVSAETAKKLHRDIIAEIKVLELMSESYPWISYGEIAANKYRKKLAAKRYLLIYQICGSTVYVDYVLDCRQDYKWLL